MDTLIDFAKTEAFGIIAITLLFINFVILTYIAIVSYNTNKSYNKFMRKLGNGVNLDTMIRGYIREVEEVKEEEDRINKRCNEIEKNMEKCLQKVGIVRYNAFSETGGSLSFALALLDFENSGFVINGVYSRDNTTTTYAKPVVNGKSKYTLVKEEEEALEIALHSGYNCFLNFNI